LLALMALVTGVLVSRGQALPLKSCGLEIKCRQCKKLGGCRLPEAVKERSKI
jgi:hypothetical protein